MVESLISNQNVAGSSPVSCFVSPYPTDLVRLVIVSQILGFFVMEKI
jgi:hypothetical protein